MEREWLAGRLEAGASYEAIARELGCSASKVSYWARKFGLVSAHSARRQPRGAPDPKRLRSLVDAGASVRQMAVELDRSATTIRYWLHRLRIESPMARRRNDGAVAVTGAADEAVLPCPVHGPTRHVRRERGFRCTACRSAAVTERRRRVKATLLAEAGGRCLLCGYDRCPAALHFHHVDPATKSFAIAGLGNARSLAAARAEARKCVVLCANCHAEVESGLADVSVRSCEPGPPGAGSADPG